MTEPTKSPAVMAHDGFSEQKRRELLQPNYAAWIAGLCKSFVGEAAKSPFIPEKQPRRTRTSPISAKGALIP